MSRFQRYGYPFQYYNNYYRNRAYQTYKPPVVEVEKPSVSEPPPPTKTEGRKFKDSNSDNVWLDLFGIKLYFDDVLILSLLFFLYKEEVKDEGLFLALILLLIS